MIVIDASVAVAAVTKPGEARNLVRTETLHAPHVIDFEVANVIRRFVARGAITPPAGAAALALWLRTGISRHPFEPLSHRVWQLRDNISAYDASYVALAERLGCDLATGDLRLGRAPGKRCRVLLLPT